MGNPSGGTVSLLAGTITFVPDANLCGDDAASFDYTVEDGDGGSATGTVTIDLTCVNDDPVASDDDATVTEDTATDVTASLLGNDTDVDTGDTLTVTGVTNATGGTVDLIDERRHLHARREPVRRRPGRLRLRAVRRHEHRHRPRHGRHHVRQRRPGRRRRRCLGHRGHRRHDRRRRSSSANDSDVDGTPDRHRRGQPVGRHRLARRGHDHLRPRRQPVRRRRGQLRLHGRGRRRRLRHRHGHDRPHLRQRRPGRGRRRPSTVTEDTRDRRHGRASWATTPTSTRATRSASPRVTNPTGGTVDLDDDVVTFTPTANLCGDDRGRLRLRAVRRHDAPTPATSPSTSRASTTTRSPATTMPRAPRTPTSRSRTPTSLDNDADIDGDALTVTDVANPSGGTVSLLGAARSPSSPMPTCAATTRPASTTRSRTATAAPPPARSRSTSPASTTTRSRATTTRRSSRTRRPTSPTSLLDNDTDVDTGDTLDVTDVSNATGGTVDLIGDVVTFTPDANLCGDDAGRLRLRAVRRHERPTPATSRSTSRASTTTPVAGDDDASGTEDTDVDDHDRRPRWPTTPTPTDDALTVTAVSNPIGRHRRRSSRGTITFIPDCQPVRRRRGQLRLHGRGRRRRLRHRPRHHRPHLRQRRPVAVDDTASVDANSAAADHDVLANDTDVDHDAADDRVGHGRAPAAGTASVVERQGPLHARRPASTARP